MEQIVVSGIIYSISNGSAIVGKDIEYEFPNALEDNTTKRVYIRSYINGYIVLTIGTKAFSHSHIEYIFIPKTVEVIKLDALAYINELKTVEFEKDSALKTLEQGIFFNSTNLKELHLPSRVQEVKNSVFECTNIESLYYYGMFEIVENNAFSYTVSTPPQHLYVCENAPFNHFAELESDKLEKVLKCPQIFIETYSDFHMRVILFKLSHLVTQILCIHK